MFRKLQLFSTAALLALLVFGQAAAAQECGPGFPACSANTECCIPTEGLCCGSGAPGGGFFDFGTCHPACA
ncbi:hypothetical protein C8R45DRAFT_1108994 [Mycena sanguinolenta]|nr:hypothetical protein C8R45DRAFT_1108994 [Mycena sanguinolenta]